MDPLITSSLVSAGAGMLGNGISMIQNRRALKYSKKLAKYQFDLNKQMWDLQNEYNSPSSQMARYQEAGLNPNLVYGAGGMMSGNAQNAPTAEQPNYQQPYLGMDQLGPQFDKVVNTAREILDSAQQRKLQSQQAFNEITKSLALGSEIAKNNAQTIKTYQETRGVELDNTLKDIQTRYQDNLYQQEISINRARIDLTKESVNESIARQQTELMKQYNLRTGAELNAAKVITESTQQLLNSAITESQRRGWYLTDAQIDNLGELSKKFQAEVTSAYVHQDYERAQSAYLEFKKTVEFEFEKEYKLSMARSARKSASAAETNAKTAAERQSHDQNYDWAMYPFRAIGSLFGGFKFGKVPSPK